MALHQACLEVSNKAGYTLVQLAPRRTSSWLVNRLIFTILSFADSMLSSSSPKVIIPTMLTDNKVRIALMKTSFR